MKWLTSFLASHLSLKSLLIKFTAVVSSPRVDIHGPHTLDILRNNPENFPKKHLLKNNPLFNGGSGLTGQSRIVWHLFYIETRSWVVGLFRIEYGLGLFLFCGH